MAKQSILTNKKILWSSTGVLLTSGVVAGVLVPVLTSKDDTKEKNKKLTLAKAMLNAKSSDDTITAMQKLYGLEIKKASVINELEAGELKNKYQSASNLATFIFANKNSYQTLFLQGKEQTTNLQEIVLIMSPKNQVREQDNTGEWPANQVNAQDQFNFLITFFKGKVVKVTKLNAKKTVANAAKIFFKTKAYDLVNLFYQFKNADSQANNFGYYNAYLDNENNTQGLALFKKYLLTLKTQDSTVTNADLTEVQFTKKSHNSATNTATAELRFSYQGLSTTKTISDFQYKVAYKLTLKARVENKMADEVQIADIDTTNLPAEVSISNIKPSPNYTDGSVIKITFNGGDIVIQELAGLTSYQSKAQTLLESTESSDFAITGKSEIFPSTYNDKANLLRQLQKRADSIANNNAKTKVKKILETVTITFVANNDQTGTLSFSITIDGYNKNFTVTGFENYQTKAQALLNNAQNNDFDTSLLIAGIRKPLPSEYKNKVILLENLEAKADGIANNNIKTKVKKILEKAVITFIPDDSKGIFKFKITIGTVNKIFTAVKNNFIDINTFNKIKSINQKIDAEVARRTKPTIKPGSKWKTGTQVSIEDIIIIPGDTTLSSKVIDVKIKRKTSNVWDLGSIFIVTIKVSSSIANTKTKTYEIELGDFVDNVSWVNFKELIRKTGTSLSLKDNDFINLRNISKLPSQIKDIDLIRSIKNIFQSKLNNKNTLEVLLYQTKNNIDRLKKMVNNNMKITFIRNNQKGTIQFTTKLGYAQQTFTITGFKTST